MIHPLQLPSGKIIDISKCIAIIPQKTSEYSDVFLMGTEQQIDIDRTDLETLQQELKQPKSQTKNRFALALKTPEEESKYREALAGKLNSFNARWEQLARDENAKQESDAVKQILDAQRPLGQKLYSLE
jgi:predicted nuclease with TOPRIM domain